MGKLTNAVLLSLHVAQTAGFAPCPPATFAHLASARRPLLTTSFRPREHGGARHLRATLSRDAAQGRAVVESMSTSLVSSVLSRSMAALHRMILLLIHQFIMLASRVFAPLPSVVLSGLLIFSAAPSLAFDAGPRGVYDRVSESSSPKVVATTSAEDAIGDKVWKVITIVSGSTLVLHTLLSYQIFEAETKRPPF